jgi:glycosyltransferase involved in cell wall biosynthesis
MIPVRNRTDYLAQAVASVLAQDPGPAEMEIWLVDNSTSTIVFTALLPAAAQERVRLFRQPTPVGMAENWNTCVSLSCGHLVHLLHDDDWVQPGFYARLAKMALARPNAGLFCCRAETVDAQGARKGDTPFWPGWGEPSHDAATMLNSFGNPLRCPAVVVRRDAYAAVGGFRPEITFYTDWEMWLRVTHAAGAWMADAVLASYREHGENITSRAFESGEVLTDLLRLGRVMERQIPGWQIAPLIAHVVQGARYYMDHFRARGLAGPVLAYEQIWRETAPLSQRLALGWDRSAGRLWRGLRRRVLHPRSTP